MEIDPQLGYNAFFDHTWCEPAAAYLGPDGDVDLGADVWSPSYGSFDNEGDSASYSKQSSSIAATYGRLSKAHDPQLAHGGIESSWNTELDAFSSPSQSLFSDAVGSNWVSASVSEASSPSASKRPFINQSQKQERTARRPRKLQQKQLFRQDSAQTYLNAKAAHSVVERRYRGKLNDKIMQLHRVLLTSQFTTSPPRAIVGETTPGRGDCAESASAYKAGKAEIMTMAIEYVCQAEVQLRHVTDELDLLRRRVVNLESLVPSITIPF